MDNPSKDEPPLFCTMKPNSRPVPDPKNKIPARLANAVAMGEMTPYQAMAQLAADEDTSTVQCTVYDSDDASSNSYYDSDEDDDSDFDSEHEDDLHDLYEIVGHMDHLRANEKDDLDTIDE